MTKPTQRQCALIEELEDETGLMFTGRTKQEASAYIDKAIKINRSLDAAEMEAQHGDWGCRDD